MKEQFSKFKTQDTILILAQLFSKLTTSLDKDTPNIYIYFFIEVHNAQDASMYRRMGLFYARYVNFKISYLFYNLAHYFNAFSTATVLTVHHLLILF